MHASFTFLNCGAFSELCVCVLKCGGAEQERDSADYMQFKEVRSKRDFPQKQIFSVLNNKNTTQQLNV